MVVGSKVQANNNCAIKCTIKACSCISNTVLILLTCITDIFPPMSSCMGGNKINSLFNFPHPSVLRNFSVPSFSRPLFSHSAHLDLFTSAAEAVEESIYNSNSLLKRPVVDAVHPSTASSDSRTLFSRTPSHEVFGWMFFCILSFLLQSTFHCFAINHATVMWHTDVTSLITSSFISLHNLDCVLIEFIEEYVRAARKQMGEMPVVFSGHLLEHTVSEHSGMLPHCKYLFPSAITLSSQICIFSAIN